MDTCLNGNHFNFYIYKGLKFVRFKKVGNSDIISIKKPKT